MLKLDDIATIEGYSVYGSDTNDFTFSVLPEHPQIARLSAGGLALRFVEYGALRQNGDKTFGGFVAFDVDLAVPEATLAVITEKLQARVDLAYQGRQAPAVVLAPVGWLDGSVSLNLQQGDLVETINAAAKPSLAGRNTACFSLELSELGTAIFKETLSAGAASAIQVIYHLTFYGRLPEMNAWGTWDASEFYSLSQDIDTEDNFWSEDSYTEVINSSRWKNDVTRTHFDFVGNPTMSAEEQTRFEEQIRNSINTQLAEAVKRNLLQAITDVDPDVSALQDGQDIEDIRRQVGKTQIANVRVEWSEAKAILTDKFPQGMLPTVTSLTDAGGEALKWEDYYSKINVDEFLKTVQVSLQVSADFADLPIHSVEVKVRYPHGPNAKTQEFVFTKPDDVAKFEAFVHEGIRKVFWSYKVNYVGSTFSFQSEEKETDDTTLVVPVDDLGILSLDIASGDINFDQVQRAQVTIGYDGPVRIEEHYNLTRTATEFKLREVIKEPRSRPVRYQVRYEMTDGRQVDGRADTLEGPVLFVDDPFAAQRTVSVRAAGDLGADIASVAVDLLYTDEEHHYTQRRTVNLSKALPEDEWSFPAFDDRSGTVRYSGVIHRFDGRTTEIAEQQAKGSVIVVGDVVADFLEVSISPDLIDWSRAKLVNVALRYSDPAHQIDERAEFTFRTGDGSKSWKVAQQDPAISGFASTITYFLLDGTRRTVGPTPEAGLSVFPEIPA